MDDDNKSPAVSSIVRFQSREQAGAKSATRDAEPAFFDPNDLTKVPGIVGRLTDWIEAASIYPNRPLALGSALQIFGTLIAQQVQGPMRGSTHLYVVGLAASASGKQQPIDCGKEALAEVGAGDRIGPGDFKSSVGLINKLRGQSALCSFIDEYGLVLQRIGNKSAGGFEYDVINALQQLWGHNWAYYNSPASAHDKSKRIFAPALSILGLSVPERFYGAIRYAQIAGGFLNRHLVIRGLDRPKRQTPADGSEKLPAELKRELQGLYRPRPKPTKDELLNADIEDVDDPSFEPEIRMGWGPGAEQIWIDLTEKLRDERDPVRRDLFGRVGEQMNRCATIMAFGRYSRTVDQLDMEWARALALKSAETLHEGVLKYTEDPQSFAGLCQKIKELVTANGDWVSRRDLKRRCTNLINDAREVDRALTHLIEGGELREEEKPAGPKGGRPSPGYALCE
jgi:hypothetical protein